MDKLPTCRNALAGLAFWFCDHYAGSITLGREALDEHERCRACAKVFPLDALTEDTLPSFMLADADL